MTYIFNRKHVAPTAVAATMACCATGAAYGAGFALIEQSVPDMGTAYAGSAATAHSAGTLFFNPAGMTQLPGTRASAALHLVKPKTEFNNEGTSFVSTAPIPGGDGGDAGGLAAVPHTYLTHQLNDSTWIGLAINAPFGLTTEYDGDWVGRYHAIKSAVKTININPSVAYKVNEQVSVALGLSAMYLDGEFTNAIDFGLIGVGPAAAGAADGSSKIEGDSWGFGMNFGVLLTPRPDTRIGIHYRSEVEQGVEGDVTFNNVPGGLAGIFSDAAARTTIDLPATFSISGFHQINPEWAIVGDYTWTGWSSMPELRFLFNNPVGESTTTFNWDDTSRVSLGGIYTPGGSDWTYRFGAAFDESPIPGAADRTARLPDNDRIWVTVGAGFKPSKDWRVDVGYAHLFIDDARISKTATGEDLTRGALNGVYEASVDILSVEAEYTF